MNLAYGKLMNVPAANGKELGFEADIQVSYEVEKNAKIIAEFAYLKTGTGYYNNKMYHNSGTNGATAVSIKYKENAIYSAIGIAYKF